MKEFVISEAQAETAILVGLITQKQDERKTKEYLDELEFLADTAGAVTVKRFTQRCDGPSAVTYLGKGKLEEIRDYIKMEEDAESFVGTTGFGFIVFLLSVGLTAWLSVSRWGRQMLLANFREHTLLACCAMFSYCTLPFAPLGLENAVAGVCFFCMFWVLILVKSLTDKFYYRRKQL